MAANTTPIFIKQGNLTPVRIVTANSNNSGSTGTLYDVVTAAVDGTRIDGIRFINAGVALTVSAATRLNIFHTVGATIRIIGQVLMPAATRSATDWWARHFWVIITNSNLTWTVDSVIWINSSSNN